MYAFNAVMPILLLVLLGYVLRSVGFAGEEFFKKANTLVFRVFLPALLFCNVYDIETLSDVHWGDVGYIALIVVLLAVIGVLLAAAFVPERLQKGPFIQCVFRSNCAILGIPLAQSLGGTPAVAFTAVATAVTIPLFNTLAVIVLSSVCLCWRFVRLSRIPLTARSCFRWKTTVNLSFPPCAWRGRLRLRWRWSCSVRVSIFLRCARFCARSPSV